MKALVLEEYSRFVFTDVPDPEIGPDDVLIRVMACGICGSDVHGMDGTTGRRVPPVIMGHEASGVIVETGKNVAGFAPGLRVTFDSTIYCGTCYHCKKGEINLCDHRRVLGVSCDEYRQNGAFAQLVAVPARILYPLPDDVGFDQAAMVEPCSVAVHAVGRAPVGLNDSAVVVGAGIIGLLVIQTLKAAGCGTIMAVDLEKEKLDLAKTLGADAGLNAADADVVSKIRDMTAGRGARLAFEAVGITPAVNLAAASLAKGGHLTLIGNISPHVDLPLQTVVTREISLYGSCASCGEYPACLDLMAKGAVDADVLISATAPLSEGGDWFARLYNKEKGLLKVILHPNS